MYRTALQFAQSDYSVMDSGNNLTIIILLAVGVLAFLLIGFLVLMKLYRRSSKEEAFVRTGFGGKKVILDGGAVVLPILHDVVTVNMRTLRLEVDRRNDQALITADRLRVDVLAEFYVRVKPDDDAINIAAQTLGERTKHPKELREFLQGKFVDALRSVASGLSMDQLHEQRAEFVQEVQGSLSEDLLKTGLELESVSLTGLDQTSRDYFKEDNAFDAMGLAKLTLITEDKREERNRIEQDTRILIETKNLDAEKKSLEIKRDEEFAELEQQRAVEIAKAEQESQIATEQAVRRREAEQARIIADREVQDSDITAKRQVEEAQIQAKKQVEEADIFRQQSVDISGQDAAIAVAKKSEEQSQAEAQAALARSDMVKQDENVETVRETSIAERAKQVKLIKAREEAEMQAIDVTIAAQAEKDAALNKAEAVLTEAKAAAEKIRITAEADHKRLEVEAFGEHAINEAKNILGKEIINFELRKILARISPQLVEASVKPMENIDSIKILQANGFGGIGGSGGGGASDGSGQGLPNQLVDAALNYRMQLPVVDKMLKELGIDPATAKGLLAGLDPDQDESSSDEESDD
jgi:uncharacterized membrane protein YqiK